MASSLELTFSLNILDMNNLPFCCSYIDPEAVVGCEDGTARVFDMYSRKCSQIIRLVHLDIFLIMFLFLALYETSIARFGLSL